MNSSWLVIHVFIEHQYNLWDFINKLQWTFVIPIWPHLFFKYAFYHESFQGWKLLTAEKMHKIYLTTLFPEVNNLFMEFYRIISLMKYFQYLSVDGENFIHQKHCCYVHRHRICLQRSIFILFADIAASRNRQANVRKIRGHGNLHLLSHPLQLVQMAWPNLSRNN